MFRTEKSVGMLKTIAMIAGLAILLWSLGLPSLRFAEAANITGVSDVLSDSAPSASSNQIITFTTPTGVAAGETITVTFPAGFNMGSVAFGDIDMSIAAADQTLAATQSGATWGAAVAGQVLTLTSGSGTANASDEIIITIGTNATGGVNQIANPSAEGSYLITLGGTMVDNGSTRVVILTAVTVSATVDTVFTFAVAGVAAGGTVNGEAITGTTGSTTIPFGKLTSGAASTSAQLLTVNTNASNGYVVTIQLDQALQSSTGADIDGFSNGSDTNTPAVWAVPTAVLGSENTYGHWGFTSDDTTTTRTNEFGSQQFAAASTSPRVVMSNTGPANGVGVGVGTTTVGYKIEISALQEAGDDYTAALTYVATPTF